MTFFSDTGIVNVNLSDVLLLAVSSVYVLFMVFSVYINDFNSIKKLIFPGAIQTCEQIQVFIHIYKTTQVHRTNTGKHNLHFHTIHFGQLFKPIF